MGIEMIRDNHGSDRFVLQNNELYNDSMIEKKLDSYEIIKILNKFGVEDGDHPGLELKKNFASKVVSKNNSKTYALKRICSDYIPKEENWEKKLSRSFRLINQVSNATKYYTYFFENNDLYMVYEFIESQDLNDFVQTYRANDKTIESDILHNIIIQCIFGLKCLHKNKILHRNIKPGNIFLTDNKQIKIGDFGFNFGLENYDSENDKYESPELKKNPNYNYDEKCDIYSMGKVFRKLCYFSLLLDEDDDIDNETEQRAAELYGQKIVDLIKKMLNDDPSSRPKAEDLYKFILPQYSNNIAKLSSINSIFHCIYSFENFTQEMAKKEELFKEEKVTPISYNYYNCSSAFFEGKNYDEFSEYLNNFRNIFTKNIQIDNNTEIRPRLILEFLLEGLNKETANKFSRDSFGVQQIEFNNDKKIALEKFNENFKQNFDSLIAKFFVGKIETQRICQKNKSQYSYTAFPFIEFNMERCKNLKKVEDWFIAQKNLKHILKLEENVYCKECKQIQEHIEYKKFFTLPQNFIIVLNWRDIKPYSFDISEKLDLSKDIIEDPLSMKKFKLIGIVEKLFDEKNEEYYVAIYKYENQWIISNKKEINICDNIKEIKGIPLLLFYSGEINIGM